ncbi:MAG: YihA family ribosome biogenesis GTP-binding protein [Acidobacteria bacterium]|nr:YihA family ribosome biogenesis GTP-binding protein [Acidobacteriota bacterium]
MKIHTAEFVTSVGNQGRLPVSHLPQVVLVGRSNVGKSTLINALARRKIARAGGAPGTTRLLNVYRLALARGRSELLLMDLPGYGYARGGASASGFDRLTERYFRPNPEDTPDRPGHVGPSGAILLVDARHPGLTNDREALDWLRELELPVVVAATKIDRLTRSTRTKTLRAHQTALGHTVLPISAKLGDGLPTFWAALLALVEGSSCGVAAGGSTDPPT